MNHVLSAPAPDYPASYYLIWLISLTFGFVTQLTALILKNLPSFYTAADFLFSSSHDQIDSDAPKKSFAEIALSLQSICFMLFPLYSALIFAFSGFTTFDFSQSFRSEDKCASTFSNPFSCASGTEETEEEICENSTTESHVSCNDRNKQQQYSQKAVKKGKARKTSAVTGDDAGKKGSRKDSREGIEYLQTNYSDESFYSSMDSHYAANYGSAVESSKEGPLNAPVPNFSIEKVSKAFHFARGFRFDNQKTNR